MGILNDMGRIFDANKDVPRSSFTENVKQAADAAEAAKAYRDGAASALGGANANPFANLAAFNAAKPGSGTVTSIVNTGQKFETTSIYDITLQVRVDGEPPYEVVHRQMVAAAALGNWQPGKVISLRVDPTDKTQVMLG